ncbi:MAG: SDR family oxidoreductase [Clostridia bacterium]|jgi:NAD(P)-dependent dehydrogenase (short-subunit alcohol dehydrogenase family)|nr:SDR family oxidoreductase [Clostridia bacterium]
MNLFSLKGKNVILTGGNGNLGKVMAKWLLEYDATLFIADIVDTPIDSLSAYQKSGSLHYIKCDLSSTASIRQMYGTVEQIGGSIDVLINNAAYGGGAGGSKSSPFIDNVDDEMWTVGIDGTVGVTFRCIREVLPFFDKQGGGNIVNIASMYGTVAPDPSIYGDTGNNSPVMYGTGKAGVIQLTKYCAANLSERGIRVNSLTPGPFPLISEATDKDFYEKLKAKTMLKREGKADELAGPLLLLCSGASSYMTGSNVVVDGGWTAW